jgi:Na+/proline symporter
LHWLDIFILVATILSIVSFGWYKTQQQTNVRDYIKGGSEAKWWTVGISVMATQASAITFLSTPGQAFHDGMGFVQFYFGLPIAVVIICIFFIPIFHRLNVHTAYEYLESRFDVSTRIFTASLFLIQRGLSAGITIFAPAIILSAVLGWNLVILNVVIGVLVIIYTVSGGTKAVSVTQKQQMGIIFLGMFAAFFFIVFNLPEGINFSNAIQLAGDSGKMQIINTSFDLENRYTLWTGLIGGSFLALSYFGTDQSQVQRYLSAKSLKQSQLGLLFNGLLKVPMQFFILLVGIMVFVFYQFNSSPIHFNPAARIAMENSVVASEYQQLEDELKTIQLTKKEELVKLNSLAKRAKEEKLKFQERVLDLTTKEKEIREKAKQLIAENAPLVEINDKDYVFIHFIINNLPRGLIGLLLAVILSAAMSSTASELNALASTTTIDIFKRKIRPDKEDAYYLRSTKMFTLMWGVLAIAFACFANLFDNLIQLVNIIGSIFYGNILGIFLLAFFIRFVQSRAVLFAGIMTQVVVIIGYFQDWMPYLWLNLFGCSLVIGLGIILEVLTRKKNRKVC